MSSKTICIAGCAGVAGVGMARCLKEYKLEGYDASPWGSKIMECEESPDPYLADMIIPVPDALIAKYVGLHSRIEGECDLCFLPPKEVVELCQDKAKTAEVLGDLAPNVNWVRDTKGAGGAGAQMAQEYLPGRNFSCELVYNQGELLGHFTKERIAYNLRGDKEPLLQRGSSAVSTCIVSHDILDRSIKAVQKVMGKFNTLRNYYRPHGVFSVDFKENEEGESKITEINAGRFLTASYVFFYRTDYNLPLAMVKAFFGETYELGEYPEGVSVIRRTDSPPWVGKL